jgi:hypothetical protein
MSTTGKPICTPINKEAILKRFDTKSKPNLNILQLIETLPEVFSREPLNPENFTQGYRVPDAEELFATALPNSRPQNFVSKPKTISKSPFSASGQVEILEAKVWYYIDEAGDSQGPFTTLQMDEWYDHKFFENDLQIRRAGQENFSKLIDALTKSDNFAARPFQKQGEFQRGQYNKPQFRSGNENTGTWSRGNTRNTQAAENKTSAMPITRNISDTKATSDKQTGETQGQLSIARNQSENKAKTAEPLNLEVQKKPEIQKPVVAPIIEKPVVDEVQPEVKVQETVKPVEPEKVVEEAPKEEKQEEQAPVEEKKEPEAKATLTQNPREFISDEWKVTIKKKKGKRGKYEEEPEEPVRPLPVVQPKREEPEAKSPTKAKEVQPVVSEQQQPKKKIIGNWGGEEPKKIKEPAAPVEEFPSLGSAPIKVAPAKKTAPVEEKKKQPVQEPKQTQSAPKEDFPGLSSAVNNSKPEPLPKTKPAAQTQEKPKAVIPESKPKKQVVPEVQQDFPTLATNNDFPTLGQVQPKAQPKANPKPQPQPKANVEPPKKVTNKPAPKENLSENPKYLNDFPTL